MLSGDVLLAMRYLRPKRTWVSVITLMSVMGPMLGVSVLIIVIAVMTGFGTQMRDSILGMQSHLIVEPSVGTSFAPHTTPEKVMEELERRNCPAAPLIEGQVLVQVHGYAVGQMMRGIDPTLEDRVTGMSEDVSGRYAIEPGEAIVGRLTAARLQLRIGDQILVHSPANLTRNFTWDPNGQIGLKDDVEIYLPEEVRVVGIFHSGAYEYDSTVLFLHLDQAADLYGRDWGDASRIHAATPDPLNLDPLVRTLRGMWQPHLHVSTWRENNRRLFEALQVEKNTMFFLLTFIVAVAAFGIAATLITVAVQKTREIGLLKAVGMGPAYVARIFLFQGTVIGTVGTVLGFAFGLLILRFRSELTDALGAVFGVEVFPASLYEFDRIPARVVASDMVLIGACGVLTCVLASMVPALYASSLSPADALRDDNG